MALDTNPDERRGAAFAGAGPVPDKGGAVSEAAAFLKALAHEGRLEILCALIDGEKTVSELEDMLGLRQAAVSQQLMRLRAERLVDARRLGRNVVYAVTRAEVRDVIATLRAAFCDPARVGAA